MTRKADPVDVRAAPPGVRNDGSGRLTAGERGGRDGFTLVELLVALAIAGTLAALAIPAYGKALDSARVGRAIADIRAIGLSIKAYEILQGQLPDSLAEANLDYLRDVYGRPYEYLRIAGGPPGKGGLRKDKKFNPINSDFDLYSLGKDGESKTQLDNKDSVDDIVRANDGGFVGLAADF